MAFPGVVIDNLRGSLVAPNLLDKAVGLNPAGQIRTYMDIEHNVNGVWNS